MTKTTYLLTAAIALLALGACSHGAKNEHGQYQFLEQSDISIGDGLMLGDTLSLPDMYCGDPAQQSGDIDGLEISEEQYGKLIVPAGKDYTDEMSQWLLLGVRDMGSGVTLAAYYAGNGVGYSVNLMTYDKNGGLLDAINTREHHLLWRLVPSDASNDTVFTLDGYITFAGDRMTLHRSMGRCVMDYDGDLKGSPQWLQQWEQHYSINGKGQFVLEGQRVVAEQGPVDQYATLDFKSWDMLICSMHDPSVMDTWNQYSELINSTYDPDYEYNPFPWDVAQLYKMNPQRFLRWMAVHRGTDNRLLPCFKLPPHDRPGLLEEIKHLDDDASRQWLTALVNSWDDKPLTKHL